jgi:uncharacterized protein (DUF2267 family)
VYDDPWKLSPDRSEEHREEFLSNIAAEMDSGLNVSAEAVTRCVFPVIGKKVDMGAVGQIVQTMPKHMRSLRPSKAVA